MLIGTIKGGCFMICEIQMIAEGVGWFWLETENALNSFHRDVKVEFHCFHMGFPFPRK